MTNDDDDDDNDDDDDVSQKVIHPLTHPALPPKTNFKYIGMAPDEGGGVDEGEDILWTSGLSPSTHTLQIIANRHLIYPPFP